MRRSIFQISLNILLLYIFNLTTYSQTSFEYLYADKRDQRPKSIIECDNTYIISIQNNFSDPVSNSTLIKLDFNGQLIDTIRLGNPYNQSAISYLLNADSNLIIGLGYYDMDTSNYLWFVKFDQCLNIIKERKHYLRNFEGINIHAIINSNNNVVLASLISPIHGSCSEGCDNCICELDQNGNLLKYKFYDIPGILGGVFDIIEDQDQHLYKLFSYKPFKSGSWIINLDTLFYVYQQKYNFPYGEQNTAKWISENTYLLSAKYISNKSDHQMALLRMSSQDNVLDSIIIGEPNIIDFPGVVKNLDFVSFDGIYYAGTQGYTVPSNYSKIPSKIILTKMDTNLNIHWQRYYCGDAYYILNLGMATSDSGFIMACSRYDYKIQNNEYDAYIMKVDRNGLITSNFENIIKEVEINAYPNPGINYFVIHSSLKNLKMDLVNLGGQFVFRHKIINGNNYLNTTALLSGIYLYRITDDKGELIKSGKWIKR